MRVHMQALGVAFCVIYLIEMFVKLMQVGKSCTMQCEIPGVRNGIVQK